MVSLSPILSGATNFKIDLPKKAAPLLVHSSSDVTAVINICFPQFGNISILKLQGNMSETVIVSV